jgi:hypothetical protein
MYTEPYSLDSINELRLIIQLADYYCALPILSRSLRDPLSCVGKIMTADDIQAAQQVRQPEWFRECVVVLAGDWGSDCMKDIRKLQPDLQDVVMNAKGRIALKTAKVSEILLQISGQNVMVKSFLAEQAYLRGNETMPMHFRSILDAAKSIKGVDYNSIGEYIEACLEPLMFNNFYFSSKDSKSGEGVWEDYFLCAEIEDKGLPSLESG